jgi:hypothetical protein
MLALPPVPRRTLWFATAYTIVILVHEAAHAVTAWAFGLQVEMFHFWANVDPTNQATVAERAAYGLAGPASSLLLGLAAWFAYRRLASRSAAAMPLLWLAASGVSNFFGNMMSAAFIGDFSNVANWMGLPMPARYALSITGALVVASVLFAAGRELARRRSSDGSRAAAALSVVVWPVVFGTAIIIAINQPVPIPGFAMARIGESAFWVFAAAGAFFAARPSTHEGGGIEVRWRDGAVALFVLAAVRIMALGIRLR